MDSKFFIIVVKYLVICLLSLCVVFLVVLIYNKVSVFYHLVGYKVKVSVSVEVIYTCRLKLRIVASCGKQVIIECRASTCLGILNEGFYEGFVVCLYANGTAVIVGIVEGL